METQNEAAVVKPKKIKTVKQEIAPVAQGDETSNFIQLAIANNAPIETMERLFVIHKEVRAEKARGEFVKAMAAFQSQCPIVEKTKKVLGYDRTVRYEYAPLDAIVQQIRKPLSDNHLFYRWNVDEVVENGIVFITATAIVTHEMGHSESSSFKVPVIAQKTKDGRDTMTAPQQNGSALTFAKRYALTNVLGISTGEEDNDATTVNKAPEAKSPKAKVAFLLRTLGFDTSNKKPEEVAAKITELTQLSCEDKNLSEVVARLSMLVEEQQGDIYENK